MSTAARTHQLCRVRATTAATTSPVAASRTIIRRGVGISGSCPARKGANPTHRAAALAALRSEADERPWFAAHLVSDAADFAATWAARRELAAARTAYALFMAGASP